MRGAKTGGRTKGTPNVRSDPAIRRFAQRLLTDADYRRALWKRLRSGDVAPQMEVLLYHYAYGKPTERLEITERPLSLEEIVAGKKRKEP